MTDVHYWDLCLAVKQILKHSWYYIMNLGALDREHQTMYLPSEFFKVTWYSMSNLGTF